MCPCFSAVSEVVIIVLLAVSSHDCDYDYHSSLPSSVFPSTLYFTHTLTGIT